MITSAMLQTVDQHSACDQLRIGFFPMFVRRAARSGRHRLRLWIDDQQPLDLALSIANANLGRDKSALPLRILDGLRLENKDALFICALRTNPPITVRLDIDDEPGIHAGRRVLHIYSQKV
jgi:hypothetical protein